MSGAARILLLETIDVLGGHEQDVRLDHVRIGEEHIVRRR
jgi:hypothetical protein